MNMWRIKLFARNQAIIEMRLVQTPDIEQATYEAYKLVASYSAQCDQIQGVSVEYVHPG